jgi:DNA-directed RNA polymerase subunit RPC12/RpoP
MAEIDINQIAKNYAAKEDFEIERIASSNAYGLRPEVYLILENEIKKRNLNPNLLEGAKAQNKEYSKEEIIEFSNYLRNLSCPNCNSKISKLNGTTLFVIKSFIIFSIKDIKRVIACPNCLDKKSNKAILTSSLMGWWGFPNGIFTTPSYIFKNWRSKKQNRFQKHNDTLLEFTLSNIGYIESYKNDNEKLKTLINIY